MKRLEQAMGIRHHICLFQSSGFGKTRACLELLKQRRGVYFMCRTGYHRGQWPVCQFLKNFLSEINRNLKNKETIVVRFISRVMEVLACMPPECTPFLEAQQTLNSSFYERFLPQTSSTPTTERETQRTDPFRERTHMPIIVFDDAHVFDADTIFHLKCALDGVNAIGIFVSTCSSIDLFLPPKTSDRSTSYFPEMQPVFRFPTDIYRQHLFYLGRPLWHDMRTHRNFNFSMLINFALLRLCPHVDRPLSLFMCRFGGLSPISHTVATTLVRDVFVLIIC